VRALPTRIKFLADHNLTKALWALRRDYPTHSARELQILAATSRDLHSIHSDQIARPERSTHLVAAPLDQRDRKCRGLR